MLWSDLIKLMGTGLDRAPQSASFVFTSIFKIFYQIHLGTHISATDCFLPCISSLFIIQLFWYNAGLSFYGSFPYLSSTECSTWGTCTDFVCSVLLKLLFYIVVHLRYWIYHVVALKSFFIFLLDFPLYSWPDRVSKILESSRSGVEIILSTLVPLLSSKALKLSFKGHHSLWIFVQQA